ncbi:MAG: ABC transporter ATP-binding protein [Chloroflexi bacterium]|nr:ABC transporter ATP-binding protein [Chloroflexota bacterium]
MIQVRDLTKTYATRSGESVTALAGVNLTITAGEFVSVVGPSGCGKTTLLKILAGLLPASGGSATLDGTPMDRPRRDIGVVFQTPVLLPWRTVFDNTMLPVQVQKLDERSFSERARDLIRLVGLGGFENKYPSELSGGMQQRNAITRALVYDPSVLLMDEPFGALDALTREQMNEELLRIWQASGKTVVFITHSIPEAVFLSDRVVVMAAGGRIVEVVDVDLPRPRSLASMGEARFAELAAHIRGHLSSKGALD